MQYEARVQSCGKDLSARSWRRAGSKDQGSCRENGDQCK